MSKRIEKEPDGYIRDLQRKKRKEIKWIVAWECFLLAIPVFIYSLFLITALAPIPDDLVTETHVFQKYVEKEEYTKGGHPAYFSQLQKIILQLDLRKRMILLSAKRTKSAIR